jgi:16S rRNA (uracil1498-N3)-methyltransferase
VGDELILFNGQGGEYYCQLQRADKRHSGVMLQRFDNIDRESSLKITLVQSLIKPDKMDFCLQKSVELGVSVIQPIITERSIVRIRPQQLQKKMQRWQGIIQAACEQSGRTAIPPLLTPIPFATWLVQQTSILRLMMLPKSNTKLSIQPLSQTLELLVGPEGGFTDTEVQQCLNHNIQTIQFGARILRSETAALAGITLLQAYSDNL